MLNAPFEGKHSSVLIVTLLVEARNTLLNCHRAPNFGPIRHLSSPDSVKICHAIAIGRCWLQRNGTATRTYGYLASKVRSQLILNSYQVSSATETVPNNHDRKPKSIASLSILYHICLAASVDFCRFSPTILPFQSFVFMNTGNWNAFFYFDPIFPTQASYILLGESWIAVLTGKFDALVFDTSCTAFIVQPGDPRLHTRGGKSG